MPGPTWCSSSRGGGRRRQGDRQAGQRRPRAPDGRPGVGGPDGPPRACRDRRLTTPWRPERIVVGRVGRPHGLDGSVHIDGHGGVVPLEPGVGARGRRPARGDRRAAGHGRAPDPAPRPGERPRRRARRCAATSVDRPGGSAAGTPDARRVLPRRPDRLRGALAATRELGTVRDVLAYPANDVLEVRADDGSEPVLVPFAEDVVTGVDVSGAARHDPRGLPVTLELDVVTLFPAHFDWVRESRPVRKRDRGGLAAAARARPARPRAGPPPAGG